MSLRKSLATLAGLVVVGLFALAPNPVAAQEDQEEALAYHAWFAANQNQDNAKAVEAAFSRIGAGAPLESLIREALRST